MNGHRQLARQGLLLLMGLLASTAAAEPVYMQPAPVQVRVRQIPAVDAPSDGTLIPGMPQRANDPPPPVVAIRVNVPSTIEPGRELEYHLLVENSSRSDAHHVTVKVPVPENSRFKTAKPAPESESPPDKKLTWNLGTLKGGESREIVLVVEPTGDDDIVCKARVSFEHGEFVKTRIAKPMLQVRTTGPQQAVLYDIPSYAVDVTNIGSTDAKNVVLTAELPPGLDFSDSVPSTNGESPLTWKLGTLPPGKRSHVEFKVIAKANGSHPLKTSATGAGMKAVEGNLVSVLVGEAKLTLVKTGPSWRSLDQPATYWLTVSNPGSMPATNIQLTDELFFNDKLKSSIKFDGASDSGILVGNDVRWSLGSLAPGSRRTVSLTVHGLQEGEFRNAASVKADRDLSAVAFVKTEFAKPTGLTLDIDKESDPIAVGKETTLTFHVRQHDATAAAKVGLVIKFPEELQVIEAHGESADSKVGQTVTFAPLAQLAAGKEADYTVKVRAERAGTQKVLQATLTTDPLPAHGALQREEYITTLPESATKNNLATEITENTERKYTKEKK